MAKQTKQTGRARKELKADPERIERWAALAGQWKFSGGQAIYEGEDTNSPVQLGLAIGGQKFRDGIVRTRLRLTRNRDTTAGIVVGFRTPSAPYVIAQIGAYNRAYCVSEYRPDFAYVALASAGLLSNLDVSVDYDLMVRLEAQTLSMSVNGVDVLSVLLRQPLEGEGVGLFAWGSAEVTFKETVVQVRPPRVFVMMPFEEPFDSLYRDVIKPVAADELGFEIVRIDELLAPGIILDDIQRQIAASHAVIAEISTRNPNVFYELGYAHALRKPAILLVRREKSADVPFDVKAYRAIYYDDSIAGKKLVERNLRAHLSAVRNGITSEAQST